MNPPILNRDFQHPADGWYDIEVPGEHPNKPRGIVQVIDARAIQSIVDTFNREADATPNFAGMLVDHEHFKHDENMETRAYGWLMCLRNKAGRPQGQIRWTGTGQAAVDKGDYRFFSSEYDPKEMEAVDSSSIRNPQSAIRNMKFLRPLRLDGLTLTNMPNNKGQKPITNRNPMPNETLNILNRAGISEETAATVLRECFGPDAPVEKILNGDFPGHEFHGNQFAEASSGRSATNKASRAAHEATKGAHDAESHARAATAHKAAAAAANKAGNKTLVLYHDSMANMHESTAADMSKEATRKAISTNRQFPPGTAGPDATETEITPQDMKSVLAELGLPPDASEQTVLSEVRKIRNRATEAQNAVIETDLETYSDRYKAEDEEFIRTMLVTNRDSAVGYLKNLPKLAAAKAPQRVHNRGAAEDPEQSAAGAGDEALRNQRNEAIDDYKAKNRCTHEVAVNMVRNRKPELFGLPKRGE